MWYSKEDQLVRAPNSAVFDKLVGKLEDSDSILFESISIRSWAGLKSANSSARQSTQIPDLGFSTLLNLKISDRLSEDEDDDLPVSVPALRHHLRSLELEGAQKTELIREKDELIQSLEKRLAELKRTKGATGKILSTNTSETVEFYKSRYENVLLELQNLKTSLSADGRLRRVSARSARAIKPCFTRMQ
jgi:hypothetical protein